MRVGLITTLLSTYPSWTAPKAGPQGTSDRVKAALAAHIAAISGLWIPSTDSRLQFIPGGESLFQDFF